MKIEEESTIALLNEYDLINEKLKLLLKKQKIICEELINRMPNLSKYDEFKPKKLVLERDDKNGIMD